MRKSAREQIEGFRRAREKGIPLNDVANAELDEADRISARPGGGGSIQALVNSDFSNLIELSKYDFSGLQPLSGLTLSIQ